MTDSQIVDYKLQAFRTAIDIVDRTWQSDHTRPNRTAYFEVYKKILEELQIS